MGKAKDHATPQYSLCFTQAEKRRSEDVSCHVAQVPVRGLLSKGELRQPDSDSQIGSGDLGPTATGRRNYCQYRKDGRWSLSMEHLMRLWP